MVYRKRRYLPYGRARSCFSWSTLAALRNPHSDICHFSLGILSGWLQILGGNGFSCVYKDLERRERYTSCIGWVLFRKVCDVFYLAYVLPNLSTLFFFCFLYMVWDWWHAVPIVLGQLAVYPWIGSAFNIWSPRGRLLQIKFCVLEFIL